MLVCAITGFAPPSVGETCALFRRRRKQKDRKAMTANVTKPAALPIPAFADFGSLNFGLPPESESSSIIGVGVRDCGVVVAGIWAVDV